MQSEILLTLTPLLYILVHQNWYRIGFVGESQSGLHIEKWEFSDTS
jgi:hypothetical protein